MISLKNFSFSLANMSSWLSPVPVLSVELSAGAAGTRGIVAVVVAGATMGSWFLLKMFLMVAEGMAIGERKGAGKYPRSSAQRTRNSFQAKGKGRVLLLCGTEVLSGQRVHNVQ